ncbi:MAG: PilZ domain-containing protein [Nannocystaceae bacterium]
MAEARFHPRMHIPALADVIGTEVLLARPIGDISLGGCKFEGPAWEETGQALTLVLTVPGGAGEPLPIAASVVRASDSDMAVRFTNPSEEQKALLLRFLDESDEATG